MTAEMLFSQFEFNQMSLMRLLADVSHDDSLKAITEEGNCTNCLLGHILAARSDLLNQMQCSSHWTENDAEPYLIKGRQFDASRAYHLDRLKAVLENSYERLIAAFKESGLKLDKMSPLPTATGRKLTWGQRAGSYICHEAYHVGQIGLMRRLLEKPGIF